MSEQAARPNRLAQETSPYLLQHRFNPVDWYPWGPEAFEKAAREQKPIFLSVGYAACHWCHVMERESFEDPAVAARLNRSFVSIKVDREERPDVDGLYQGVVHLMGRAGGWPLSVFLTPDGRPFFGGTYFPPRDAHGLPGFGRLLDVLAEAWADRREEVERSADSFQQGLAAFASVGMGRGARPPEAEELAAAAERILGEADERNGGFFAAPKFPHPMELAFLLRVATSPLPEVEASLRQRAAAHVRRSLERMAAGGIHDQLAGGFHRYTVDEAWRIPHFEKMLTDNALLLGLYAEAFLATGEAAFARVARRTAAWLEAEMRDPGGAFWSSQDADTEGEEGRYFVWRKEEVESVLGPDLAGLAAAHWGVRQRGDFEGANVLHVAEPAASLAQARGLPLEEVEGRLEEARRRLLEARRERTAPAVDDKVLASWNGLAIGGLATAGRCLEEPRFVELAEAAASQVWERLWDGQQLWRVFREGRVQQPGFLDDYAHLCEGLVQLFESSGAIQWFERAAVLADALIDRFWDDEKASFFLGPHDGEPLLHRMASAHDQALPAGASSAAAALSRLFALEGKERWGQVLERYLAAQGRQMTENPFGFAHLLSVAHLQLAGPVTVAVLGPPSPARDRLLAAARGAYRPEVLAFAAEGGPGPLLAGRQGQDGGASAWICRNFSCELPRTDASEVADALRPVPPPPA